MDKKIFFVISSLSGGGAERVICNLANYFGTNGYRVTLVCFSNGDIKYHLANSVEVKMLVHRKPNAHVLQRLYYAISTFVKLLNLVKSKKPVCCISFMTAINMWTGLCCLLLNHVFIVSERTSPHYSLARLNPLAKWCAAKIYGKARAVVLPAKSMMEPLKKMNGFSRLDNLVSINNPLATFKQPTYKLLNRRPYILSVGRIDADKGFDLLIDAYNLLDEPCVDLLILGMGPLQNELQEKVIRLGLQHKIKFIGFKENLQDYYANACLFVLASKVEGYPNVLIEAMSFGCAVIAANCDFGPSEIIEHGINGLLVKPNDVYGLAEAMQAVLSNRSLNLRLSANAKLVKHTNSISTIARQWEKLILA